jgi:hypothetical protein
MPMENSICRIYSSTSEVVGAGVLVSYDQILTCSHVVNRALSLDPYSSKSPESSILIEIDFPFLESNRLATRVVRWSPAKQSKKYKGDVATLQLEKAPPDGYEIAKLAADTQEFRGKTVRSYGFPSGHDEGVWADGILQGSVVGERVQVDDPQSHGHFIIEGFSGSPIFDNEMQCVYGLVALADERNRSAFMIPSKYLVERIQFLPSIKGNVSWKLEFFKSSAMNALLNDLEYFEAEGLDNQICQVVQSSLGRVADATSDFEGLAFWESPIHKDIEKLGDIYYRWNSYPKGNQGASDRRQAKKLLRDARKAVSDKIRQCRGVLYQGSFYLDADDDMFETIFSAFNEIANAHPTSFSSIRGMLTKYNDERVLT